MFIDLIGFHALGNVPHLGCERLVRRGYVETIQGSFPATDSIPRLPSSYLRLHDLLRRPE
jgi:hypothetical protein